MSGEFGKSHMNKRTMPRKDMETISYPSLAEQAKNFVQTAKEVVRDPRWVDEEEYERRMGICRACHLFDHKQVRCKKCGCKLKGKARFKAGHCPIQKW